MSLAYFSFLVLFHSFSLPFLLFPFVSEFLSPAVVVTYLSNSASLSNLTRISQMVSTTKLEVENIDDLAMSHSNLK